MENTQDKYMVKGLNNLEASFTARNKTVSEDLMFYIERKIVAKLLAEKQEVSRENLDKEFDRQVAKFGHAAMFYRDAASQRAEIITNKAVMELKMKEHRIHELQVLEYEMNLKELEYKNTEAKSLFTEMGQQISQVKDLLGLVDDGSVAQKTQSKWFDAVVGESDILTFAKKTVDAKEDVKEIINNGFSSFAEDKLGRLKFN